MTQITIIVDDKTVIVGGRAVVLPSLDWSAFKGQSVNDKIHAVQFDSERGHGHVEYCDVVTEPATRPNQKPHNWLIDAATFDKTFGWVMPLYAEQCAADDAASAAAEAESEAKKQHALDNPQAVSAMPAIAGARQEDVDALRAQLAEQQTENKRLAAMSAETAAKLDAIISEVSKETSRAN